MITIYVQTGCAYTAAVLHALEELAIPYEEKNIADEGVREELIEKGGKDQIPFIFDSSNGIMMYEAGDIVEYLMDTYGKNVPNDEEKEVPTLDVCT